MFVSAFQKFKKNQNFFIVFLYFKLIFFFLCNLRLSWISLCNFFLLIELFLYCTKLGDDNCFSFGVELNFRIKACLFLCFKYTLKKFEFFLFFL